MSRLRLLLLSVLFAALPVAAFVALPVAAVVSQPPAPGNFLEMLRPGGYVIVLRHGATTSDAAIDPMRDPGKTPAGERELSISGRAQARSIGRALHELKIPVSLVMTSPQQRAVDTATLLDVGDVTTKANLAEADAAVSVEESYRRAAALRALVSHRPPTGNNLVIVTHKPNLVQAFGRDWSDVREGEAAVFEPNFTGTGYRLVARIQPDEWQMIVQASHEEELTQAPYCSPRKLPRS